MGDVMHRWSVRAVLANGDTAQEVVEAPDVQEALRKVGAFEQDLRPGEEVVDVTAVRVDHA